MSEQEKPEGQKTVVAFIAGLLIGGLLVWVFSSPAPTQEMQDTNDQTTEQAATADKNSNTNVQPSADKGQESTPVIPVLPTGDGAISVAGQAAGNSVVLTSAEFPTAEGWVAVRDYDGENVGGILGAARYSQSQGLIPQEIELLRSTVAGTEYAVVFFTEDGAVNADGKLYFDPAGDKQIDAVMTTFKAE